MTDRATIEVDQYLPHPPARAWRALTDPGRLGFDGVVHCEVLAVEPERLLRWAWRGATLDTTVTWLLRAEGRGTRLFLRHDGFDPDDPLQQRALTIMGGGWRSHIMRALDVALAEHD